MAGAASDSTAVRRNVLASSFWVAPDARERAREGERLLADAVHSALSAQSRPAGHSADEVLQMAHALHSAGLMSDAEITSLRASLVRPRTDDRKRNDTSASLLRRRTG
jgi:hypothetical protein